MKQYIFYMRYNLYSVLSTLSLAIGFVFIINSASPITGYSIVQDVTPISSSIFSISFFAGAIWLNYLSNKQKRGQAAMEFLMTYGWAILAAIVAIGVLAYFGVFSNNSNIGGIVLLSPPFLAQASNYENGTYNIELLNGAPAEITVTKAVVGACGANVNTLVKSGDTFLLNIVCPQLITKSIINIYYKFGGTTLTKISIGNTGPIKTALPTLREPPTCGNGGSCIEGSVCDNGILCIDFADNGYPTCAEPGEQCDDPENLEVCSSECKIVAFLL